MRGGPIVLAGLVLGACSSPPRPTEFINITYTPAVDTAHYATWAFDLEGSQDFGDPRVDDEFVREHLLAEIESELTERGFEQRQGGAADFLVSYELWIADTGGAEATAEWGRGRIFIRDVATGRYVWRGERKAFVSRSDSPEEGTARIRAFVQELLQYAPVPESELVVPAP